MSALTPFVGTPSFNKIEGLFDILAGNENMLFGNGQHYPPYNAWFEENGDCLIEMAVAGFTKDELTIEFDGRTLLIKGDKEKVIQTDGTVEVDKKRWIKQGLARRSFARQFEVRGNFILDSASLKNGILRISLKDDTQRVSVTIQEE